MSGPQNEDERVCLELVSQFLGKADTQALHGEVKSLREDIAALKGPFESTTAEIRRTNEELQRSLQSMKDMNARIQDEMKHINLANADLQKANTQMQEDMKEVKLANAELNKAYQQIHGVSQTLQSRLDQATSANNERQKKDNDLQRTLETLRGLCESVRASQDNLRGTVKDLEKQSMRDQQQEIQVVDTLRRQVHQVYARMNEHEGMMEEIAQKLWGYSVQEPDEPDGEVMTREVQPAAIRAVQHDDNAQRSDRNYPRASESYGQHNIRTRAPDQGQEDSSAPRATQTMSQQQNTALQPVKPAQERTTRSLNSGEQQRITTSNTSGYTRSRLDAIREHYNETKRQFEVSQPKDQRRFIWVFIDGCNDEEFEQWLQETLLETLPSTMVRRAARNRKAGSSRIIALTPQVTWDEVRGVIKEVGLPKFLDQALLLDQDGLR